MIHIRPLTTSDLPMAMRLKVHAGWNQLEADWRWFLSVQPDGCLVAELDGTSVGTTVTCIFGDVAWVAMVLVEEAARGRGVGTALMQHALEFLDGEQVRSVRLDATPLGRPLYEKLGFVSEYTLARYHGTPAVPAAHRATAQESPRVFTATQGDHDRLLALDREVTGIDRSRFLERLFLEHPEKVWFVPAARDDLPVDGYLATRAGSTALQVGPCLGTPKAAAALLTHAVAAIRNTPIIVDVPQSNWVMTRLCESLGLGIQRTITRMCRGPRVQEDLPRLAASSGPELG